MKTSYGWKLLPYRGRFLWALAQVFLIAGFELLKPWPLQVVIDDVLGGKAVGFALLEGWSPLALWERRAAWLLQERSCWPKRAQPELDEL
jgi:hypothetical protein